MSNPPSGSNQPESTLRDVRVDDSSDMTKEHRAVVVPPALPYNSTATGQHRAISVASGRFRKPAGPWGVALLVVAALVSFFAVSQLRSNDDFQAQLNTESEGDLTRILARLSSESTAQQEELAQLRVELANAQNSSAAGGERAGEISDQLNALKVLSATVPVTGPGLELTINDPSKSVTYDALVDAVQELRDAGAEALSINGRRIGVASSFSQTGSNASDRRISLDGVALPTPYTLSAIGSSATMEGGLQIPGGTLDTLRSIPSVNVEVHRNNVLNLPGLENPPTFRSATPVTSN